MSRRSTKSEGGGGGFLILLIAGVALYFWWDFTQNTPATPSPNTVLPISTSSSALLNPANAAVATIAPSNYVPALNTGQPVFAPTPVPTPTQVPTSVPTTVPAPTPTNSIPYLLTQPGWSNGETFAGNGNTALRVLR